MTSMFVEDNFMVRDEEALNETINYIQSTFKVKIYDNNSDYLGCEFIVSSDNKRGWLGQPHVVKSLDKKFGQLVQDVSPTKTPGSPGFMSVKPFVEELLELDGHQT